MGKHLWKEYDFGDGALILMCSKCQRQFIPKRKDAECDGAIRSNTTKARKASDVSRYMQKDRV